MLGPILHSLYVSTHIYPLTLTTPQTKALLFLQIRRVRHETKFLTFKKLISDVAWATHFA